MAKHVDRADQIGVFLKTAFNTLEPCLRLAIVRRHMAAARTRLVFVGLKALHTGYFIQPTPIDGKDGYAVRAILPRPERRGLPRTGSISLLSALPWRCAPPCARAMPNWAMAGQLCVQ